MDYKHLKTKIIYIVFLSLLVCFKSYSQTNSIITSGEIVYQKKENVYNILDNQYATDDIQGMRQFAQSYKKDNSQFKTSFFTLDFNGEMSIYQPSKVSKPVKDFLDPYSSSNIVQNDYKNHMSLSQKTVFDRILTIKDSTRKIRWRLTNETRDIAGFTCRRANAIIMDSVYVVAFYTDQIVTKGGPESFTGLPGMILGVALPNEHVTWFATEYKKPEDLDNLLKGTIDGKTITQLDLSNILDNNEAIKKFKKQYAFIKKRILL